MALLPPICIQVHSCILAVVDVAGRPPSMRMDTCLLIGGEQAPPTCDIGHRTPVSSAPITGWMWAVILGRRMTVSETCLYIHSPYRRVYFPYPFFYSLACLYLLYSFCLPIIFCLYPALLDSIKKKNSTREMENSFSVVILILSKTSVRGQIRAVQNRAWGTMIHTHC